MAKSNRRRKLDRAKRQVRDAQRQAVAGRRLAADEAMPDAIARFGRLFDPSASVAELVSSLNEEFCGDPVSIFLVNRMVATGFSLERLAEAAETMLAPGDAEEGVPPSPPSLTALTFAADVARAEDKAGRARELLDQALAVGDDDAERQMGLLEHMRISGRLADCLSLLEAVVRDTPDDERAAEFYGMAIHEAYQRVDQQQSDQCSCGRGASWQECCGPRERAALSRFTDRSGLSAISEAVATFLVDSEYGRAVDEAVAKSVADYENFEWKPDELASFRALLAEHALIRTRLPADDLDDEDDREQGEAVGALAAFAVHPSVPLELAAKAHMWRAYFQYGLWRIDSRSAAPGLWCTDICSGVVRYAEFPAQMTDRWPRWSVWLGGLVPVDGVWRATGLGLRLSPAEADAVAELVEAASETVVEAVADKSSSSTWSSEPMRFGDAKPFGVLVDGWGRMSSDLATLTGMVTGLMLSRIVAEVHLHRTPPALHNPDGDLMCFITAWIAVNDSEQALHALAGRPGFEPDPDDPARLVWYGIRVPKAQPKGVLGTGSVGLGAFGLAGVGLEDPAESHRWARCILAVNSGQLMAVVNSDKGLARLLDLLSKLGAAPTVTYEHRIDPAREFGSSGGGMARWGGAVPSGEGWEKYWLDEQVPALGGCTPREATSVEERPMLEALLRQFEYESDVLVAGGKQGIDTDWLRQELDMADEVADETVD